MGKIDGADIHGLRDGFIHDIDDKLTRGADILGSILWYRTRTWAIPDANGHNGRIHSHIIVGTERGGVELSGQIHAGNPGNRARCNQADQHIVNLSGFGGGNIEIHIFRT